MLNEAVRTKRLAVISEPENVNNIFLLSSSLHVRFERLGNAKDNDETISLLRGVLDITPGSWDVQRRALNILSVALRSRYEHFGTPEALDDAISTASCAVDLVPDEHPEKVVQLAHLCDILSTRFERTGKYEHLDAVIFAQRRIMDFLPDGNPIQSKTLNNLCASLAQRFVHGGELEDLDAAIIMGRRVIDLTPAGHSSQSPSLGNVSGALVSRFEHVGKLADLEEAITMGRRAVNLTADGHRDKPALLNNLGVALYKRFERVGELGDLETAISIGRQITNLTSDAHPLKPTYLNNLATALHARFTRVGKLEDIDTAISVERHAVDLMSNGHTEKARALSNLGNLLQVRFVHIGELEDLELCISTRRRAVDLMPDDHSNKATVLSNFGCAVYRRFLRLRKLEDLEVAILAHRRGASLMRDGHPDIPTVLTNLGNALWSRFECIGRHEDLEIIIETRFQAVELTPIGHRDEPARLNNLGNALRGRFDCTGELADLDAAILTGHRAVDLTADENPNKSLWLSNLGLALQSRFERKQTRANFHEAYLCFKSAAALPSSPPFIRFESARINVRLLATHPAFATAESLLDSHSQVLRIIPELVWLGHSLDRRYEQSSLIAESVYEAVSTAVQYNMLERAVEWLETGRSVIWSQLLALRTPLDELLVHHPKLSQSLRETQLLLQQSAHILRSESSHSTETTAIHGSNPALDRHRTLTIQYDSLLSQIRENTGFEDFLLPKRFSALIPHPDLMHGYFVFLNVHQNRCDALVLLSGGMLVSVDLPDLSTHRANLLQTLWIAQLQRRGIHNRDTAEDTYDLTDLRHSIGVEDSPSSVHLQEHTWSWIVLPILKALELPRKKPGDVLPHITWCPTGPLTRIPLHAAGLYSEADGPRVFDYVVSSYAPSLSALVRSGEGLAKRQPFPSALIVTQPATPGQPRLSGTVREGNQLRRILDESRMQYDALDHRQATVESVRAVMDRHPWVHFACHGSQRKGDPTKSAFHLYDAPLSLSDLMQTASDNAELAFLSACQTATGDENNPEEAVHLAAGMLAVGFKGIVATMWSIGDADAPIVVEAYYKELLKLRRTGTLGKGETGAAYALHKAVKELRERVGERDFVTWAPFVHFGV